MDMKKVILHTEHPIPRDQVLSRLICRQDLMDLHLARILP